MFEFKNNEEVATWDVDDFIKDIIEIIKNDNIPKEVLLQTFANMQQNEVFSQLALFRSKPGAYRAFLSKVVAYIPLFYARYKIDEIISDLKDKFKIGEHESSVILNEAIKIHFNGIIGDILEKYSIKNVNNESVPDYKEAPFKVYDKSNKEEELIHH